MKITISCPNHTNIEIHPGDNVDFGPYGLLVYYAEPEAEAIRILQRENAKRVQSAIEFTKNKFAKEIK